jgi:formylglycine-generating enzyme
MTITINAPDRLRKQVEAASGGKNTVLYTAKGQPCFMAVIPKFNVQDIDAQLGTGVHPAFIVGGVEKNELFIGQHLGSDSNSELISVPGVDPRASITHDAGITLVRNNGTGWHLMTNAEWAALALWCVKNGTMPNGNTAYGRDFAVTTEAGQRQDGIAPGTASGAARTLTGSGPTSWRHDRTPYGISDLNGNVWEWTPGMRIVDGEIHVIADNDAALTATSFAVGSGQWMAIDGATGDLVAPGHANAVKYGGANSGTNDYTLYRANSATFAGMVNSAGATPVSAAALEKLKQLGLFPMSGYGDLGADFFYITMTGERVPRRGGSWSNGSRAGVFALNLSSARSDSSTTVGVRPAFVI